MHNEQEQTSAPAPRFKGKPVEMGGDTYIVPPLALGPLKDGLLKQLRELRIPETGLPDEQAIDVMLAVIGAAVRRNYPALTDSALGELIDLGNLGELFRTVIGQSGLQPKPRGSEGNSEPRAMSPSSGG